LQVAVVAAAVAALLALPIETTPIVQLAPFVTLADGRNISYELRGDAASTYTLLYLHRWVELLSWMVLVSAALCVQSFS